MELLGVKELADRLGWSPSRVSTYLREPRKRHLLPPVWKTLACGPIWREDMVECWISSRGKWGYLDVVTPKVLLGVKHSGNRPVAVIILPSSMFSGMDQYHAFLSALTTGQHSPKVWDGRDMRVVLSQQPGKEAWTVFAERVGTGWKVEWEATSQLETGALADWEKTLVEGQYCFIGWQQPGTDRLNPSAPLASIPSERVFVSTRDGIRVQGITTT